MYLILLAVGVLVTAIGLVTIGFGIPINAFSLGNTLIITGATAVVGGLILIGLAAAVRQLKRIAEALNARPLPRPNRPVEAPEAQLPQTARMAPPVARPPVPPLPPEANMPRPPGPRGPEARPPEPRMPDTRMPEPRFPAQPAAETKGPLDWLRPKSKAPSAESAMLEVPDEAPLSPRPPMRPAFASSPVAEPALEPKVWSPSRGDRPEEPRPVPRSEQIPRAAPSSEERGKDQGLFDVMWPPSRQGQAEPGKRDAQVESPPSVPRDEPMPAKRSEAPAAATASADRPPAILKSGVIDGMAYTLYVDGAIEAELPQGTVRFASVDALRAHLEKNG